MYVSIDALARAISSSAVTALLRRGVGLLLQRYFTAPRSHGFHLRFESPDLQFDIAAPTQLSAEAVLALGVLVAAIATSRDGSNAPCEGV
jgi:hypothetical protein